MAERKPEANMAQRIQRDNLRLSHSTMERKIRILSVQDYPMLILWRCEFGQEKEVKFGEIQVRFIPKFLDKIKGGK